MKTNNAIRAQIDAIRRKKGIPAFQKWRQIGEIVKNDLIERGQFFNTDQGLFLFDNEQHQAFCLHKDEVGLASLLNRRYGILSAIGSGSNVEECTLSDTGE